MYAAVKCVLLLSVAIAASGFSLGPTDVVFHLFTRENPAQSVPVLPNFESLLNSQFFSPLKPVAFNIHTSGDSLWQFGAHFVGDNTSVKLSPDYRPSYDFIRYSVRPGYSAIPKEAHLESEDVNVFLVDWSAGSSMYSEGLSQAPQCGRIIANFINMIMNNLSIPPTNFRIVGHGLGGHIAGIAARHVTGTIPHIVALDPSLHGWTHHPDRLQPTDATVVEVLHTTAGNLGYDQPLGTLNFYANGGTNQPTCGTSISCSHEFAYIFYGESVRADSNNGPKFVGTKCDDYEQALANRCSGERDATFGGIATKTSVAGVYTFSTNFAPPFARD